MFRLSKRIERLEKKLEGKWKTITKELPKYIGLGLVALYLYGLFINSVRNGIDSVFNDGTKDLFIWNPMENLIAIFTPTGFAVTFIVILFYCLFTKKGYSFLSGYKTIVDKERNIEILPEGIHGTSGWMTRQRAEEILDMGSIGKVVTPLVGKLTKSSSDYIGIPDIQGMNKNIVVYGSPGTGKSRGIIMPFVMSTAMRSAVLGGESLIMVDPKAEFFETFSEYLRNEGYFVRAFNLLDLNCSDGWNFIADTADDNDLIQVVAEIIISNTSNDSEKQDFWEKSEKNLLMALIYYVQSLTDPETGELLPIEQRSLGTIYKLISTTSMNELDARMRGLPAEHPALLPYGIFRQAHKNIWGNILIGLGSRLNVFQNKLVDSITKHSEIDLVLPGKKKCAYFCIISDQDTSLAFLSSMFLSLLFVRLYNFARTQQNRRLPIPVNVVLEEYCNTSVHSFGKILGTARSRGIQIIIVVQSVAQLSERHPRSEWLEIIGDCDFQVFLGCNDTMTADFISKQCGTVSVRVNNAMVPQTPLFSPVLSTTRPYTHSKTSTSRALMLPDEVRRLKRNQVIVIMRGELPMKLYKIQPEEHPEYEKLVFTKSADYIPEWRKHPKPEPKATSVTDNFSVTGFPEEPPAFTSKPPTDYPLETEEIILDEKETELNPPQINLFDGINCERVEISPDDL